MRSPLGLGALQETATVAGAWATSVPLVPGTKTLTIPRRRLSVPCSVQSAHGPFPTPESHHYREARAALRDLSEFSLSLGHCLAACSLYQGLESTLPGLSSFC